ncbi:hypothetical protein KAS31_01190 [Candidatus Parcubacteria bacterium]|nr:hypothetical protein [Candidatus Parcubacteria bacterium]
MTTTEFQEKFLKAKIYYEGGKYYEAIQVCNFALTYAKNDEEIALVLNKRGYAERYFGFKSTLDRHRENSYKKARADWKKVLEISSDIELKISAIKGLMLLPGEDIEALYQTGEVTVLNYANNLIAEIMNSYGLVIRETDIDKAISIFTEGYGKAKKGSTIAGHLMQNIGTCWLMLKNQEESLELKKEYAISAIGYLKIALQEYPEDQIEHRRSVQEKIDNTQAEIENNFQ